MRTSLRSFLERAALANPDFRSGRVESAFEDVDALIEIYREEVAAANLIDLWSDEAPAQQAEEWFWRSRRRDALHKAIIEAANIAFTVLLHEARGCPGSEITISTMLSKPWAVHLKDEETWRQLYALNVYRNKVIVHHEVWRSQGALGSAIGDWRLLPHATHLRLDDESISRLRAIASRAQLADMPDNLRALRTFLFWNLPVQIGQPQSPDRREVDKFATAGGVQSLTISEIDELIELALLDDIHKLVLPPKVKE